MSLSASHILIAACVSGQRNPIATAFSAPFRRSASLGSSGSCVSLARFPSNLGSDTVPTNMIFGSPFRNSATATSLFVGSTMGDTGDDVVSHFFAQNFSLGFRYEL